MAGARGRCAQFGARCARIRAHRAGRIKEKVCRCRFLIVAEGPASGSGEQEAEADADALYWDRIPIDQRAAFVWQLSRELHFRP